MFMKKKNLVVASSLIILMSIMFVLSGCGKKTANEDVEKYLKDKYPNESFSVISKKEVDNIPVRGNGNGTYKGNEYTVKSNDTGIEFVVKTIHEYTSYGTGNNILDDNYKRISMKKCIENYNDNRIRIADTDLENNSKYFISDADLIVDIKDFETIDELASILFQFKNYYEERNPFKQCVDIQVKVYKNGEYKKSLKLSSESLKISENDLKADLSSIN